MFSRKKSEEPMADKSKTISLTPSDCIGAVKQAAAELAGHMNLNIMEMNLQACTNHCQHIIELLDHLTTMQASIAASMPPPPANGKATEARAN